MDRHYAICYVLVLAWLTKANGASWGRTDMENRQGTFYPNNPFFNSSFPVDQYPGRHHHHHYHDYNYNQNGMSNNNNHFLDNNPTHDPVTPKPVNDFGRDNAGDQFPENPKVTIRREVVENVVADYPYDEIRKFLDTNPLLKQYFAEIPQLSNRVNPGDEEGENLCKMQTLTTYYPKILKNLRNVEKVVVNDEKNYTQAIQQTRCVSEGECSIKFEAFGYTSYCHQNFDNKRLLVFENSTKQIVFDEFKVPSCCVCKIKKV